MAIVGGGVVGLVCAIGLARAGVQVDLFEAAVRISPPFLSAVSLTLVYGRASTARSARGSGLVRLSPSYASVEETYVDVEF